MLFSSPNIGSSGNIFNPNQQSLYDTDMSAQQNTLYIFSPREYKPQAIRPINYNFDPITVQRIVEAVDNDVKNLNLAATKVLTSNGANLSSAALPSLHPMFQVNLTQLDNPWTWVLIVTDVMDRTRNIPIPHGMHNKLLYTGFFIGEPINPLSHMGRTTLNNEVQMITTHKTMLSMTPAFGRPGGSALVTPAADRDIIPIHGGLMQGLASTDLLIGRPEDLAACGSYDHEDRSIGTRVTDQVTLAGMDKNITIDGKARNPVQNVRKIIQSASSAKQMVADTGCGADGGRLAYAADSVSSLFEQHLRDTDPIENVGPAGHEFMNLEQLVYRYTPKIIPLQAPRTASYGCIDQHHGDARSMFSSLLSSALPGMLVKHGMAGITFNYSSIGHSTMGDDTGFDLIDYDPLTQEADQIMEYKVKGFMKDFRLELVPILKDNHGDFSVQAVVHAIGITRIILNFYSDSQKIGEAFEVPTIFGGLLNPLLSDRDTNKANIGAVTALQAYLTQNYRQDTPPFQQDMSPFDTIEFNQNMHSMGGTSRSLQTQTPSASILPTYIKL